jgi:hypothetical protein
MISARKDKDEDAIEESELVGAQGFVTKTDVPFVLLEAVDKLIQGQTFFES